MITGSDGNFYGTTIAGGTHQAGTVFNITSGGVVTIVYNFSAPNGSGFNSDGEFPYAGVVEGGDGAYYGTTNGGARMEMARCIK